MQTDFTLLFKYTCVGNGTWACTIRAFISEIFETAMTVTSINIYIGMLFSVATAHFEYLGRMQRKSTYKK